VRRQRQETVGRPLLLCDNLKNRMFFQKKNPFNILGIF
jgi:hypothetical protein